MADVVKIALDRRAELRKEVAKIDDFIRMAEALIGTGQLPEPHGEPAREEDEEEISGLAMLREVQTAARERGEPGPVLEVVSGPSRTAQLRQAGRPVGG